MRNAILVVVVLLIIVITWFAFYSDEISRKPAPQNVRQDQATNSATTDVNTISPENIEGSNIEDASTKITNAMEYSEARVKTQEFNIWSEKRGYSDSYRDYGRLSESDLESLADQGNMQALHELASRVNISDPESAISYLNQAAVYGSTYAMVRAGQLYDFHTKRGSVFVPPENSKTGMSTALAYHLAAQMSGDDLIAVSATSELMSKSQYDDELIQRACNQADELTLRFESKRMAIGLNDFDRESSPKPPDWDTRGGSTEEICGHP